uniref:Uncharacterized protein n=1 Tax=Anopheles albimanus TaxID=7167 RepID=A0A182FYK9_ANOAL
MRAIRISPSELRVSSCFFCGEPVATRLLVVYVF